MENTTPWVKFVPPKKRATTKLSKEQLKIRARDYFKDFLSTYKREVETRYPHMKDSLTLYKNLPVKVNCVINTKEDVIFSFITPSDSKRDEVEVKTIGQVFQFHEIQDLFREQGAEDSIHQEFSSIGTFLSVSPHSEANSFIVNEARMSICRENEYRCGE